jgi:UDP-2,3-diacylglucosamine pyrophosphatase LpxH
MRHVISDLHLGVGRSNEFYEEPALREYLLSIPDRTLIVLGDLFELLKDDPLAAIYARWSVLIDLIVQKALVIVPGNHDRFILDSSFTPPVFLGIPVARIFVEGDTIYLHGDQFDPMNNDSNRVIGDTVTGMVGWLAENVSPDVNAWSRDLEALARDIGRNGDPVHYRNSALAYIEHMLIDWHRLRRIVLGHTHQVDHAVWNDRFEYFNAGCFGLAGHTDTLRLQEVI